MGKKKKYLITSINFGKEGDISRKIIEKIKADKINISDFVNKAIVFMASSPRTNKEAKAERLKEERKLLKHQMLEIQRKITSNGDELVKLGEDI